MKTAKTIKQPSTLELLEALRDALTVSLTQQQVRLTELSRLPLPPELAECAARAQETRALGFGNHL